MTKTNTVEEIVSQPYKYGFITEIETEKIPKGLNEDVIRLISAKKNEPDFLLKFRLRAYEQWLKMKEPDWSGLTYSKVNYQDLVYYAAPKKDKESIPAQTELETIVSILAYGDRRLTLLS